ncbi:MAG: UDP-N-acetylgalactosamine-undecaprenyl-phosphate N-acetylgalactosaminephosphotransferase [Syntrophaceae bacterium PtaB.Bin095]|nr:MAG: UDP-N-acetylgalactosamine-undecaprenyl-phosphate N-acetylgalactosaminephosphotransferase [Syntrophaceae bacterium PtaB.Bin095]
MLWGYKRYLIGVIDGLLILASIQLAVWVRFGQLANWTSIYREAMIVSLVMYLAILYVFDMYNIERIKNVPDMLVRIASSFAFAGILLTFFFFFFPGGRFGRGIFFIHLFLSWFLVSAWRLLFSRLYRFTIVKQKLLIIGAGKSARYLMEALNSDLSEYEIIGFLDDDPRKQGRQIDSSQVIGYISQFDDIIDKIGHFTAVIAITRDRRYRMLRDILQARIKGVTVVEMPNLFESITGRIPVKHIQEGWLLFSDGFLLLNKEFIQRFKRLNDVALSVFLMAALSPIALISSLLIKLESRGPVLFVQKRVGKDGLVFDLIKLRSMYENAESNGPVWAEQNDSRVTKVGRWIRRFRFDEIPQLWNILRGEMSFIGPRPERPEFVSTLEKQIPYYYLRHAVKPGLTGWAQVNYPYGASLRDAEIKLEYDLYYLKNMSLLLDFKILLKTIGVIFFRQGSR